MTWFNAFLFFAVGWWIVLFAVLPWGMRTQEEAGEVVPGTVSSAPVTPRLLRVAITTTLVTLVLLGVFWLGIELGWWPALSVPSPTF
jgi:predicted secreted protein